MRDNFSKNTKDTLAQRVCYRCSNPKCRKPTCGPRTDPTMVVNIGVAAHITAASKGGPRFDPNLSNAERRGGNNGIWLCQNCAKLIDNDSLKYSVDLLKTWKVDAENFAKNQLEISNVTDLNWKLSLSKQLTTFSRVEFSLPPLSPEKAGLSPEEVFKEGTRIIFHMLSCAYLETCNLINRDNFTFGLSFQAEGNEEEGIIYCWGELITHLTPFAYHFGVFADLLNRGEIDELVKLMDKYPQIPVRRQLVLGRFVPFKISRVNPSKIFIENIIKPYYHMKGKLSTSDLILYFSSGVNGGIFVLDDQNCEEDVRKNLKLMSETMDGFDLSEIWINPDNPEDWAFN